MFPFSLSLFSPYYVHGRRTDANINASAQTDLDGNEISLFINKTVVSFNDYIKCRMQSWNIGERIDLFRAVLLLELTQQKWAISLSHFEKGRGCACYRCNETTLYTMMRFYTTDNTWMYHLIDTVVGKMACLASHMPIGPSVPSPVLVETVIDRVKELRLSPVLLLTGVVHRATSVDHSSEHTPTQETGSIDNSFSFDADMFNACSDQMAPVAMRGFFFSPLLPFVSFSYILRVCVDRTDRGRAGSGCHGQRYHSPVLVQFSIFIILHTEYISRAPLTPMSEHIQTTLRLATAASDIHVREIVRYSERVRTPDFMSRDTLPEDIIKRIETESVTSVIVVVCSGVIVFRFKQ